MSKTDFPLLDSQLRALLHDETDNLAAACNFVAVLYYAIANINWLGLYVLRGDELRLGPFQGQSACAHIALGSGVCGTAAVTRQTQRVADVHQFDGHIACDANSRSELVIPLCRGDRILGVLDIDSPLLDRFSVADQAGAEKLVATFLDLLPESRQFI